MQNPIFPQKAAKTHKISGLPKCALKTGNRGHRSVWQCVTGGMYAASTTLLRLKLYVWHSRFCVGDGVLDVPLYAPSKLPANGMSGGHPLRITRSSFVERNKSFRLNVPVGAAPCGRPYAEYKKQHTFLKYAHFRYFSGGHTGPPLRHFTETLFHQRLLEEDEVSAQYDSAQQYRKCLTPHPPCGHLLLK